MVCEELGLLIACMMVLAVILLACFAIRSARTGRSAYYSIAACAAMTILLTQLALNVFGSMDILPFTGVTFPFVSRGGSSMLSCWMMMAFLKSADNRREASFAVRPGETIRSAGDREAAREARLEQRAAKKQAARDSRAAKKQAARDSRAEKKQNRRGSAS